MGKKSRNKKKRVEDPTLFVFDGSIRSFDGGLLELKIQVTPDEWKAIVVETTRYKVFLECLKGVAFPILHEKWEKDDEWWLYQLTNSVSKMRSIDPMVFITSGIDQEKMKLGFTEKMQRNAAEVVEQIKQLRNMQRITSDHTNTEVSEL